GSIPEGAPPMAMWNSYVWVDSADDTASKVRDAGGTVLMEPFDIPEAGRMAVFADPERAAFMVWQAGQHTGTQVGNEPGAVKFTVPHTRNLEAAKPFYKAVLGWDVLVLDGGAEFWSLPGYGEHIASFTPGFKEMVADSGVPGFENVVAGIVH